jgi:SAM-dependent methyltransferase
MKAAAEGLERYTFKASPHSSHSKILELLPPPGAGRRLLDLGCGPGHLARRLAERGYDVTAVDIAVPVDVVEHLVDPDRVLAWTRDHLAPGGRAIVCVPNVAHLYVRLKLLAGNFDPAPRGILDATHMHFYTRRSFERLLDRNRCRVLRLEATAAPLELLVPASLQGRVFRRIDDASALAARLWPGLLAYQFVSEIEPVTAVGGVRPGQVISG